MRDLMAIRLSYICNESIDKNSGVGKKITSQINALSTLGVESRKCIISPSTDMMVSTRSNAQKTRLTSNGVFRLISKIKREYNYNIKLATIISGAGFRDIIYLRMPYPSHQMVKIFKNPRKCKVVLEHQSMEQLEYKLKGKSWYVLLDILFGKGIRNNTDAIVCVTDEITSYQLIRAGDTSIPHITIGNGFEVDSVPKREAPRIDSHRLDMLCVANVSRWHGLDRLLRGLASYDGAPNIALHIAGDGSELNNLKQLANELDVADRVIFHGFMTGKALDALFDQCHIAVGSLGIHRKGLMQTSELKAREYCARGIPYVIACADPDFPADFPYILHLPADESPIDIDQVITFAQVVCADPYHPQKMRCYAREHLDWSVKMKKLKGFLETLVGEDGTS